MTLSTRAKSILALVGTLLLGALLGALATGRFVHHRMSQLEHLRTPEGFASEMASAVEPRDSAQARALRETLRVHARRMRSIRDRYQQELRTEIDSLHQALGDLLAPEQEGRMREKMQELHREGEHRHHRVTPFGDGSVRPPTGME